MDEDDIGTYSASDSDDEYTETEKKLLSKVRHKGEDHSESEDEVFGVASDSESNDKSDLAVSDIEGQDDDLPDIRAWGKDKRQYYKTDYVDADYGGFQGKDAQLAEQEEEEARNLQKQLAQQLDEDDFTLDMINKKIIEDEKQVEEIVKTDVSKLSSRQKVQLLQKESPEFFSLVEDFEAKIHMSKDYLYPALQKYKKGQIPNCQAVDFVQMFYELILNYCTNIYMYLTLKSVKTPNLQNHPVIKRLYQYRQLLLQLEPTFENIIKPQIELLLQEEETANEEKTSVKKNTLKLLSVLKNKSTDQAICKEEIQEKPNKDKKKKVNIMLKEKDEDVIQKGKTDEINPESETSSNDGDEGKDNEGQAADSKALDEKRAITYQMAKNKGLTPHRKKEQRNPRVKHKLKYRKAIIRRKGAVREVRKELKRYDGEISGIKATVSKSIKIKT